MYGKIIFLNPSKIFYYFKYRNTIQEEPYVVTNSVSIVNFLFMNKIRFKKYMHGYIFCTTITRT